MEYQCNTCPTVSDGQCMHEFTFEEEPYKAWLCKKCVRDFVLLLLLLLVLLVLLFRERERERGERERGERERGEREVQFPEPPRAGTCAVYIYTL